MTVTPINPNILILEFRQDKTDKDYGSCLWARFYFNLDRYELLIESDCGSYGYKWVDGTKETFLELIARMDTGYFCDKMCGRPSVFDYEATKNCLRNYYAYETEDVKKELEDIFESIEDTCGDPEESAYFIDLFTDENDGTFEDIWECIVNDYSPNQKKICEIFETAIQPKVKEIIKESKEG